MALAPAIGPILGGWLQVTYGWQATFWVLTGFSGLALIGVLLMLDETNAHRDPGATSPGGLLRSYRALLSHRGYVGYVATISACYCVIFCFISGSSFFLIPVVGLTADVYALCFPPLFLCYTTFTFISSPFSPRILLAPF